MQVSTRGPAGTPFPFEGPVHPELLINREDELEVLGRRAADRVSVRVVAPRRFGKTSLLIAHAARLREVGWRTAHVDLAQVADLVDVARRFAAAYADLDSSWVRAQLGGLLSRIGLSVSAVGPTVTLGPRPTASASEAAEAVLLPLLDLPKTLWDRDQTPTLVVLDEFQDLLVARKGIDGLLRSRIQYHGDAAAYVYAGSEPSLMRELFDSRERPLFGQALPLALDPLPFDTAISDLGSRFADEGLDPGSALGELVGFAAGHPQRTLLLCYLLAEALSAGQSATPALAADIVEQAVQMTEPSHQAIWQASSATERAVLAAVADGLAPTSHALAAEHNLARTTLGAAADRLMDQGHLIRAPRASRLIDPLLGEWLRRR